MGLRLVVKVVGKEIQTDKTKFTAFSVMTAHQNWYRTAKIDAKELEKVKGETVAIQVSRKFDKAVIVNGEKKLYPTLVIESLEEPTIEELNEFNKTLNEYNAETLKDIK